jgi:hypothetical protein
MYGWVFYKLIFTNVKMFKRWLDENYTKHLKAIRKKSSNGS